MIEDNLDYFTVSQSVEQRAYCRCLLILSVLCVTKLCINSILIHVDGLCSFDEDVLLS